MKCGRVYEVAGRLRRRMDDVLDVLKDLGIHVSGYSSLLDDEDIGRVAAAFGKTVQLPFIPDIPAAETDGQKMPVVPAEVLEVTGRILDDADESLIQAAQCPDKPALKSAVKLISNESKSVYIVKANMQLLLIPQFTRNEKPCRFRMDRHVMINGTLNPDGCMVALIIGSRIYYEPASFAVLDGVWYFDAFGLIRSKGLDPVMGIEWEGKLNPRYSGKFSSYKKSILACKRGYAIQAKSTGKDDREAGTYEVNVRVDPRQLEIAEGSVGGFSWNTANDKYTLRGNTALRAKIADFIDVSDNMGADDFEAFLGDLLDIMKEVSGASDGEAAGADVSDLPEFDVEAVSYTEEDDWADMSEYVIEEEEEEEETGQAGETAAAAEEEAAEEVSYEYAEETETSGEGGEMPEGYEAENGGESGLSEETASEEDIFEEDWEPWMIEGSKEEEAYLRLCAMVQAGLAPVTSREFLRYGSIFYSQGPDGTLYSLEDNDWLADTVSYFEESYDAVAYYGIITDSVQGQLLNIFYVTEDREQWGTERQWLDNLSPMVYIENLDHPELSSFGSIHFRMVGEGTVLG